MDAVAVFCGSSSGRDRAHLAAAEALGRLLAGEGITLLYGGASVGTMGALARASLEGNGKVVGVIPRQLVEAEIAADGLSELHVVDTMHQRKALMADLADGFVALPGGLGTLEETAEIATWTQLGLQNKPIGLLNTAQYFDHLLAFLDHAVVEQFLRREHRDLLVADADPVALLAQLRVWRPPTAKWVDHR